jgi:hypothetical protein
MWAGAKGRLRSDRTSQKQKRRSGRFLPKRILTQKFRGGLPSQKQERVPDVYRFQDASECLLFFPSAPNATRKSVYRFRILAFALVSLLSTRRVTR